MESSPELEYTLKKLLLKRAFAAEMRCFLLDASSRHSLADCPVLCRSYQRVLSSPLVLAEDKVVLERLVDHLPHLQRLIRNATGRDLAVEISNVICNSWSTSLEQTRASGVDLAAEDRADVALFFSQWESNDGEEESESSDDGRPPQLPLHDPSLARRRVRRREFSAALRDMVGKISEDGFEAFSRAVAEAATFSHLPAVYRTAMGRLFSVMRLLLLDGLSIPRNRKKADRMLTLFSLLLNVLLR